MDKLSELFLLKKTKTNVGPDLHSHLFSIKVTETMNIEDVMVYTKILKVEAFIKYSEYLPFVEEDEDKEAKEILRKIAQEHGITDYKL